jgi:predicted transcriptional regulator
MANRPPTRPTNAELEILHILWKNGPSTVREVREALVELRPTGYTTALKMLQIMHNKGLVVRDEAKRSHVYEAKEPREVTQTRLLRDIMERAFDGSPKATVIHLIEHEAIAPEDRAVIREKLEVPAPVKF